MKKVFNFNIFYTELNYIIIFKYLGIYIKKIIKNLK